MRTNKRQQNVRHSLSYNCKKVKQGEYRINNRKKKKEEGGDLIDSQQYRN
jgi:hypothetical protein